MIRRLVTAGLFLLWGFPSLVVTDRLYRLLCTTFEGLCARYSGPCPDIDSCDIGLFRGIFIGAFYLGPSVAFAAIAFFYARHRRGLPQWISLAVGFVLGHFVVATLVIQLGIRFS